jgi:hypothetical protein
MVAPEGYDPSTFGFNHSLACRGQVIWNFCRCGVCRKLASNKTGCVKTQLPDILRMSRKRDFAFRTPIMVIQTVSKTPRDFFHCGQFFSVGRPARWSI